MRVHYATLYTKLFTFSNLSLESNVLKLINKGIEILTYCVMNHVQA